MKKITIVIPTRNRLAKLKKTLDSIPIDDRWDIIVICDNDANTFKAIHKTRPDLLVVNYIEPNKAFVGAVKVRNYAIKKHVYDGCLYATDDIIFAQGSLAQAYNQFNEKFPDDDGVLGFIQKPNLDKFHPTGVALVGYKFLLRYPDKQLFYPELFHFACQEIHMLATKYNKFYQCQEAIIWHYNPCTYKEEHDQTHEDARKYKKQDMKIIKCRKENKLIWGDK